MLEFTTRVGGEYFLRRVNAETGQVMQEVGPFHNLITDIGLNRIGYVSSSILSRMYIGTGTNPASVTDSNMGAFLRGVSTSGFTTIAPTSPNWSPGIVVTGRFNPTGSSYNITEVGVGWGTNVSALNAVFSRELTVDTSGNPVSISVLGNEYLDVVYRLNYKPILGDFGGSFTLNSEVYNYTARLAYAASSTVYLSARMGQIVMSLAYTNATALGPVTGTLTGEQISIETTVTPLAYSPGSYTNRVTSALGSATGNAANGINGFVVGGQYTTNDNIRGMHGVQYQMLLDRPIPKTSANTMSMTFEQSWARG